MTATPAGAVPTVRDARARYFAANRFDERGYADRWVRLQAGPIPIFIPNTRSRVRAVRVHDVHHVVTGYARASPARPRSARGRSRPGAPITGPRGC